MNPTQAFSHAREFLLRRRTDYDAAMAEFRWPRLPRFNWAIDWFDEYARNNTRTALRIVHDGGDKPREVSALELYPVIKPQRQPHHHAGRSGVAS